MHRNDGMAISFRFTCGNHYSQNDTKKKLRLLFWSTYKSGALLDVKEVQHPLTGQCPANFRLLANQWAERRLLTQWCHGFRAMRRSVCNTGASNVGRSLCVQVSRERSYPLPIYWYHSKGNWMLYNSAADSFYSARKARIASAVLAIPIPSVRLSVCLSVTRRYCVKTTAHSMVQFAPLDSKMCLFL